jgi:hypothetical protein
VIPDQKATLDQTVTQVLRVNRGQKVSQVQMENQALTVILVLKASQGPKASRAQTVIPDQILYPCLNPTRASPIRKLSCLMAAACSQVLEQMGRTVGETLPAGFRPALGLGPV